MTRLGPDQSALFVRTRAGELARIWREARAIARPSVFPGLIDGVVESFFETCGDVLSEGRAPDAVWSALVGVVRFPPGHAPEVHREWALLSEVLTAAADAVQCDKPSREWFRDAASDCRYAMAGLLHGLQTCPPRLVLAVVFSPFVPPRARHERKATDA